MKKKKMKVDKEGSKKKKKAKGIKKKHKAFKRIVVGGLIICVAIGVFTFGTKKDGNIDPAIKYADNLNDSCSIIIYEKGEVDPEPENLNDLYLLADSVSNSLIKITEGSKEDNVTLICGNASVDGIDSDSKNIFPVTEVALIEDIIENCEIDTNAKFAGIETIGGTDYTVYLDRNVLDELLINQNCNKPINNYTTSDGKTYTTMEDYLAASVQNNKTK